MVKSLKSAAKAAPVTAPKKTAVRVSKSKPPKPPKPPAQPASEQATAAQEKRKFPIVGIGASAGGLEALEDFLTHVRTGSGMAYVVVQHLDPTHKGILPELLQRTTKMAVMKAGHHMPVQPNCVYVIPSNKDLTIVNGQLHLAKPSAARGLRLPIDLFLRSLATDREEYAIGVILSGMGSDGTLGLRAIKEKSGLTVVQDPAHAKFDSMPRSAIAAGLADIVAPAEELPRRIGMYFQHLPKEMLQYSEPTVEIKSQGALDKIILMLSERSGTDFSLYKINTIYRRIERRMSLHQIETLASYARYVQENKLELDLLFKELMIGVTRFFRDPPVWEYLKNHAIPDLLQAYPQGKTLRAWVPACSTGEEAYTLAIVFKEALAQLKPNVQYNLQIFATDLDPDAIDKARAAVYPDNVAADLLPDRLHRYLVPDEGGYRISKEIREMVVFATQNIIIDPPFTRLDILSCRNLMIYFEQELQRKLLPLFYYALNPNGLLLLGSAETAGSHNHLFSVLQGKLRLYQRIHSLLPLAEVNFPIKHSVGKENSAQAAVPIPVAANLAQVVEQLLLQNYVPPAVLINSAGDILFISGRTGNYLELATGKVNGNIYAMARDGLGTALASAIKKALQQQDAVSVPGVKVGQHLVNVTAQVIATPEMLRNKLIVVFNEMAVPPTEGAATASVVAQQAELRQAYEEVQTVREEMQTSQEELKSTNEELQSTNEELQSTNEELTTSAEEMQSLNEELQTVNAELEAKLVDLFQINNDMKNLLNSTEIAVVFLDNELHLRRFTPHATQLFKLIPHDVGRPLSDIVTDLNYPKLQLDAQAVLHTLIFSEKSVTTHDGRYFKVRIMPYRTQDNKIDSVVITFTDITLAQRLEMQLRTALLKLSEAAKKKS